MKSVQYGETLLVLGTCFALVLLTRQSLHKGTNPVTCFNGKLSVCLLDSCHWGFVAGCVLDVYTSSDFAC